MNIEPAGAVATKLASHRDCVAHLTGTLRIDQLEDRTVASVNPTGSGRTQIALPGFEATIDSSVRWHSADGMVVLVQGHPVNNGRDIAATEIASLASSGAATSLPLGGRYAVCVLDVRGRRLLLQTDRFGVWPLCWSRTGDRVDFSDRSDTVSVGDAGQLDQQAIFDYVYFHMIPAPRTVFRGVARVEPSTTLTFDRGGTKSLAAWQPAFARRSPPDRRELRRRFRAVLENAVAAEASNGVVGSFLSGGTDSSTVAGTLKQLSGHAPTFSIGFDAAGYDEMAYARIAARHFGTEHHEHYVTPSELVAAIPQVAAHYDQPFGNSSAVPAFICAEIAKKHGLAKLLAGDGGDELFGGNTRYARQKVFEVWWHVPGALRAGFGPLLANPLMRKLPLARKAASYVDQASVPMPERMETYNLLKRFGSEVVFTPEFLASVDSAEPAALQRQIFQQQSTAGFVDRMLAYDWRFTLADNDLPKVSGTTRLAGLEVGYPLLADELVDFSTTLGPSDKVRGLQLRHFFKEALADFLPPEIIAKKKHGFGLPVGPWLVADVAFRTLAHESLQSLVERGLIQPALVDDLFSRKLEEHAGYYGEMVWVLMMLEQWLRAHATGWSVR